MDSWQCKEGKDTDLKRPWNEEKIYNVNSEISRFRVNLLICIYFMQLWTKFCKASMDSTVEVKMVKSDHEYLKDIRKNVISLPPPLLRGE